MISFTTKSNFAKKSIPYFLIAIAFFMPVYLKLSIIGLFVLTFAWLLSGNWLNLKEYNKNSMLLWLLAFFWLLHAVSLVYSTNLYRGLNDIQQKLSFIIFPLIFYTSIRDVKSNYNKILIAFVSGLILSGLICLINATYQSLSFANSQFVFNPIPIDYYWENYFSYSRLSFPRHPTYFAMFYCLGIAILFYFAKFKKERSWTYVAIAIVICFFVLMVFLLSSRAGILVTIVVFIGGMLWLFLKRMGWVLNIVGVAVILLFLATFAKNNERFSILLNNLGLKHSVENRTYSPDEKSEIVNGDNIRTEIWLSIPEIVGPNWIFGFGIGDSKQELLQGYKNKGLINALDNEYNAHNQYLETFAGLGILGFLLLLSILIFPLYNSFRKRKILLIMFITIIALNFIFESVLERIGGVIFLGFFYCLFILMSANIEET